MRSRNRGFTLIEVMIVVAVVAVLAAIAYPSYDEQVRRSRRADAQTALVELSQHMERHFTAKGTYVDATLPFDESPKQGDRKHYDLDLSGVTATTYTLRAQPKGAMAKDRCGTLVLEHTGATDIEDAAADTEKSDCWRS